MKIMKISKNNKIKTLKIIEKNDNRRFKHNMTNIKQALCLFYNSLASRKL